VIAGSEVCENPAPSPTSRSRRQTLNRTGSLGLARALVAVALAAAGVAGCKREEPIVFAAPTSPPPASPAAPPTAPGAAPAAAPPAGTAEDPHIAAAQLVLARDPKNVKAWIALGNEYFDGHQPQKAIDAYARALELDPKNPDVLTDQGVMYRDVGAFDKAIANFQRASKIDPHHVQSLYNMGVVYAYDLKDAKRAVEAWNRVVEIAPTSPQAAEARKLLDEMKQAPPAR
jgi:cytochrome c-type biogenesis protein CcmH/NrfG